MLETGVVLGAEGEAVHWHTPEGRSAVALPESPELWDVLWENRGTVSGFAHSHPGGGEPVPSYTDVTTFAAIEAGLGRRLDWWISTNDMVALFRWAGPSRLDYDKVQRHVALHVSKLRWTEGKASFDREIRFGAEAPVWVTELNRLSQM